MTLAAATPVRRLAVLLVTLSAALAGCSGGPGPGPLPAGPTRTGPTYDSYVALGDSFTAAPFVPTTDLAGGCLRSNGNYPSRVHRRLHIRHFTDVSCSGATTRDLTHPQVTFGDATVPPQLDAVRASTDLVTVGIGGNDFDLFGSLVGTCTRMRSSDPTGAPCTELLDRQRLSLADKARRIGRRVGDAVRAVQRRAPHARVLLVGYPRIAPDRGTCVRLLPLADGDYAEGRRIQRLLDGALASAARRTGVEYVDLYSASRGHDVCSADPWVNGRFTREGKALAYHPFATGMEAAADLVVRRVSGASPGGG